MKEDFHSILEELERQYNAELSVNTYLRTENKKLKEDAYKDTELAKMKEKYEAMHQDLMRGFPITKKEMKNIEDWQLNHEVEKHGLDTFDKRLEAHGCCGGGYVYKFLPTSIGTIGYCICSTCGEKFCFQDL